MDQNKPFKTIEVIDSRTGQTCKVACMSCIRGHRTTSCGISVCRTKVFWTVKRPGRPSNSCTCRFGGTGRCQCVVAKSACPHKPKKGEKRSIDCRCDEQGRYCCLLEPEHWDALCQLQNPKVDFYVSREALDGRNAPNTPAPAFPPTPSYSAGTPQTVHSSPATPGPTNGLQFVNTTGEHFSEAQSPARPTTRFGFMGLGAPMGDSHQGADVLTWDGQAPTAPRPFQPFNGFQPIEPAGPISPVLPPPTPYTMASPSDQQYSLSDPQYQNPEFAPVTESMEAMSIPSYDPNPPHYDFDKLMADYINYQFPAAICQSCGMNGCTCINCPQTMQNVQTGSWGHCCSKKHAFPVPMQAPRSVSIAQDEIMHTGHDPTFTQDMEIEPMDLSELLMNDLEKGSGGCCCGDVG
jgi:hypothetical protein